MSKTTTTPENILATANVGAPTSPADLIDRIGAHFDERHPNIEPLSALEKASRPGASPILLLAHLHPQLFSTINGITDPVDVMKKARSIDRPKELDSSRVLVLLVLFWRLRSLLPSDQKTRDRLVTSLAPRERTWYYAADRLASPLVRYATRASEPSPLAPWYTNLHASAVAAVKEDLGPLVEAAVAEPDPANADINALLSAL